MVVDDINDNRPLFQPYTYDVTMAEHSASGTSVALLSATDKDLVRGPVPFLSALSEKYALLMHMPVVICTKVTNVDYGRL